jgi:hypothetical protein
MKFAKNLELFQNQKTGFNNVAVLEEKEEKENHSKRQREQTLDRKWQTKIGSNDDMGFLAVSVETRKDPSRNRVFFYYCIT